MQLPVTYHQQDQVGNDSYCGAASAQMVLYHIGAGLLNQTNLFSIAHNTTDTITWHSAPDGLREALENNKGGFPVTFQMWPLPSIEAMSRKVCWSIFHHGLPAVVLRNGSHWVVVKGFEADHDPGSPGDTSYKISKFYVHNPEPATILNPPPHKSLDVDHEDDHCHDRGSPDEEVDYSKWIRMHRCRGGTWKRTYIVICDSDSPADTQDAPLESLGDLLSGRDGLVETRLRANRALADSGLPLPRLSEDAPDELEGERFLVEEEDYDPPEFYYLVPFRSSPGGEISLLVSVSAHVRGDVNGWIAAPGPNSRFSQALTRDGVLSRAAGDGFVVDGKTFHPTEAELHPNLVWQPCIESLSPYLPFYRFDMEDGSRLYVRIDGEPFLGLRVEMGM